jgi:cytochrome c biogenesis protein CcdA/thiol-disulfide isomerase/thioredoxin
MILLLSFAFLAGVVTILSPCILPILPLILSGTVGGRSRPYGIVLGFIASFTFFTLFLASIVGSTGISADALRVFSIIVIFTFGVALWLPAFEQRMERIFNSFASLAPTGVGQQGFWGGVIIGLSLGLVWTPCVGPILASVISLALTGSVTGSAIFITLAYAVGTAVPMLAIILGGQKMIARLPSLRANSGLIRRAFGVLMILTALAIWTNFDRKIQIYLLDRFPQWGVGLTSFEQRPDILNQLGILNGDLNPEEMGQPTFMLLQELGKAPELIPGGVWFNSQPLTLAELRGKVVLIDFWTYTCINCIRTLPYLRDWHEKYSADGLVIIGVHAPEFEFEKSEANVAQAIEDYGILYPVMQDNNFSTWRAYNNRFWPAKYLIDKTGQIRYRHFGEGSYDQTEAAIQQLLGLSRVIDNPEYQLESRTPELYLGYARLANFASPEPVGRDAISSYSLPENLPIHHFGFSGDWLVNSQRAVPRPGSALELAFESRQVFLVMRPTAASGRVRVLLDGQVVTVFGGEDVVDGVVSVTSDRLYRIIDLDAAGRHRLRLEFVDGNLELYAFTFG